MRSRACEVKQVFDAEFNITIPTHEANLILVSSREKERLGKYESLEKRAEHQREKIYSCSYCWPRSYNSAFLTGPTHLAKWC